ncbi:phosphatidylglycerol lysyltransferase domain-containing protein [Mesorhizobium sp. RCC_202]|uniref:phosphatidylglycerol lysyltransferase domain-containing protein n=1 Tax=Mesorhizobium sp. RCC_202 TaxID=3239222 RepID=UPI003524FB5C
MPSLQRRIDRFFKSRSATIQRLKIPLLERLALVRRHGNFSLAYSSAVQRGLHYYGDEGGYIAYGTKAQFHFALGDPVVSASDAADYVGRFVAAAGSPTFVQVGLRTAQQLAGLGYKVNRLGIETKLLLPAHDFSGTRNETVRYSERWLLKKGFTFTEDKNNTFLDEVSRLSENWRGERLVKRWEMAFLNRPFANHVGTDMRRFVLRGPEGDLTAILDFDPMFLDGKLAGYTTAFKRKQIGATSHSEVGLTKFAVDRFRQEGISVVSLGLSPMLAVEPSGFLESDFWRVAFRHAYRSPWVNRSRFNLQGQAAFKRRFHGLEEPTYIAFRKGSVMEVLNLLRLIKAF